MPISTSTSPPTEPPSKTILIVDDTPDNLRLLASLLSSQGYSVRLAPSAKLALMGIQQTLPDLILLDIRMPEISGYEICRRLKADPRTHNIPIIFLSALQEGSDKAEAFDIGGADYITKPFQTEEVMARVRHQLQLVDLQQQLQQQQQLLLEQNRQLQQEISDRKRIERELKQEKTLLRNLIDAIPDLIFHKDQEGRYILWNQAFESFTGLTGEAIHYRTDADLFAEPTAYEVQERDRYVLQTGLAVRYEEWIAVGEQPHTLFEISKVPVQNPDGDSLGLIGICHDITHRKANEQTLLKTSQTLTDFSNSLKQLHRLSISQFENSTDLFNDYLTTGCQILNFSEGSICSLEDETYVSIEDETCTFAASCTHAGTSLSDPSMKMRLETAQILCDKTIQAGRTLSHTSACALPMYQSALFYDDGGHEFGDRPVGWQSSISAPIFVSGRIYGAICFFSNHPRPQGFAHHEQEIIELMAQSIGKFIRTRQVENEIQRSRELADAANRAKSEFLANISHELRTPLNAILGFTQLLLSRNDIEHETRDHLDIVNRSGEHLLTLINDVLEMSKIEAGKVAVQPHPFDLYSLLQTLEEMFSLRAKAKHIRLTIDRDPRLPQHIETDESKLRQVLINLLGNAVKFTQDGQVTLRVKVTPARISSDAVADAAGPVPVALNPVALNPDATDRSTADFSKTEPASVPLTLSFEVEDTGPGIPPDELTTLFDPFVQTSAGRKSQEGTGLGLPISQRFVELLGGDLEVKTELHQGSVFSFSIEVLAAETYESEGHTLTHRAIEQIAPDQPQYRLLVVEDHPANRLLLVQMFEAVGFSVKVATDGVAAINIAQTWRPHLIWMDIRMPQMDGYEATRQIKAAGLTPSPIIIALTASAFEEERSRVLAAGCDDFVSKPFQTNQIFQKIAQYLPIRYIYRQMAASPSDVADLRTPPVAIAHLHQATDVLKTMPLDWLRALKRASILGSDQQILELIRVLPPDHNSLQQTLANWAQSFQFDTLLELIETVIEDTHEERLSQ